MSPEINGNLEPWQRGPEKPSAQGYTPPVGPGSKSVSPAGDHRSLHPDLLPQLLQNPEK